MSKTYICAICSKELSNRHSLSRHKRNYCKGISNPSKSSMFQSKNSKNSQTQSWERPTNPKIVALADAIINDDSSTNELRCGEGLNDTKRSRSNLQRTKNDIIGYEKEIKKKSLSDITGYRDKNFKETNDSNNEDSEDEDSIEDKDMNWNASEEKVLPKQNSGEDSEDENSSEDEEMDFDGSKVKFLPSTLEELTKRFNKLIREYNLDGKIEHRNELVSLLDEMLRQKGIDRKDYEKLNNKIVTIASREEDYKNIENSALKTIIQHDVKELKDLLKEFREELDEEDIDTLLDIEELVDVLTDGSYIDDEPVLDKLLQQLNKLDGSKLNKLKLLRFEILSKDIEENRLRVKEIMRMFKKENDDSQSLIILERSGLLTREQARKIEEILKEGKDLKKIANVIKSTKIGNGLEHLPTSTKDLKNALQLWLTELTETGMDNLKEKIEAVLNELLRRRVITQNRYNAIKEINNIF